MTSDWMSLLMFRSVLCTAIVVSLNIPLTVWMATLSKKTVPEGNVLVNVTVYV